jgi:hypothetical protein
MFSFPVSRWDLPFPSCLYLFSFSDGRSFPDFVSFFFKIYFCFFPVFPIGTLSIVPIRRIFCNYFYDFPVFGFYFDFRFCRVFYYLYF